MIENFRCVEVINLHEGCKLRLSGAQAKARAHCLVNEGKGMYQVIAPVQFKQNEIIGIDKDSLNKVFKGFLESCSSPPSEKNELRI